MEYEESVTYRPAYGMADNLAESDEANFPGRWRNNPAAGGTVEAIIVEVSPLLAVAGEAGREIVREAIEESASG